jgi:hypothetical protein
VLVCAVLSLLQVNVRSQKCRFEGGCDKVPSYGEKNGTAKFCIAHKVSALTTCNT